MIRKIVKINEDKCDDCGLCAEACHEGAIAMIRGKARLMFESHCDGLGDCLPICPTGAITFEEREAPAYDEDAVRVHKEKAPKTLACGCPGTTVQAIKPVVSEDENCCEHGSVPSSLRQWPVQIKLVPENAPYFSGADILVAADCTAYAYGNFHNDFIKGRICLVGCPKLDMADYSEKLTDIIVNNHIKSVTVTRMEVPCCSGLAEAVKNAVANSGKDIPWDVVTISTDGRILD
ncbi:MAG: 4Fe-4S binding protein [Bacillota bacterium]|nr:4Fe-4S binding protein [Bacillota bacterium]